MKYLCPTLLCVLSIILVSCQGKGVKFTDDEEFNETVKDWVETAKQKEKSSRRDVPPLTEEVVAELWKGIPDHGINRYTKSRLSKEFYNLVDVGFSIPTDAPGEIGSEEYFMYWYVYEDVDGEFDRIEIEEVGADNAKVTVYYKQLDHVFPHVLKLILEERTIPKGSKKMWVIDDFDDMKSELTNYIRTVGQDFLDGFAEEAINTHSAKWFDDQWKMNYLQEAERFKQKYYRTYPHGLS